MSIDGFWTQPQRDPKRKHRFLVVFPNMPNGATWYAKKCKKPKMSVNKTEHKYLGHTFKYPGSVTWDDVTVTLVDPVSPDAAQNLAAVIAASGYVVPKNFNSVTTISKANATAMLGEVQIIQIDESAAGGPGAGFSQARDNIGGVIPGGFAVEVWTLKNPWLMEVDFGELDYESDDLSEINLTLTYDFATLTSPNDLDESIKNILNENGGGLVPAGKAIFEPI